MFLPAGHKISKMGKGVSKRTRTFKNSFTTRMQINNKEQEIEKYFLELGHRFYEDHVDNPPLEYRDCMEAIYVLNQEICGAKEHLKLLQGIRLCPDCQGESPIDAAFCAYCGHPFPPLEEDTPSLPDERLCPRCGEKLADNAIFCIKCGLRLDEIPPEMTDHQKEPVPPWADPAISPEEPTPTQTDSDIPAEEPAPTQTDSTNLPGEPAQTQTDSDSPAEEPASVHLEKPNSTK